MKIAQAAEGLLSVNCRRQPALCDAPTYAALAVALIKAGREQRTAEKTEILRCDFTSYAV